MQNYLQQPQQYGNFRPVFYKALPIANEAEMNNYTVDFNGTPTYFHNQMTNEIYVKQFDMRTGLTSTQKFVKYEPTDKPENENKEENNKDVYKEELDAIYGKLNGLEETIKKLNKNDDIKGVKNAK
jgi:hypothetical protein